MTTQAPSRETWYPTTDAERQEVLKELRRILDSPAFRSSRRYPAFLGFVVEKAVAGEVDHLKERMLGIEVFHRPPDYDTSTDPIVRFTAGEVRKRIAQFYTSQADHGPVEISLPVGSYVPRFYRRSEPETEDTSAAAAFTLLPISLPPLPTQEPQAQPPREEINPLPAQVIVQPQARARWLASPVWFWALLCVLLTLALAGFVEYRKLRVRSSLMQVWAPMLEGPEGVLISAGRPHPETPQVPESQSSIGEHIMRPEFRVSITTVAAISQVAGFLESQHRHFRIHEANSNSLADLHGRPVVLIAGNDNKWTLLLMHSLRFQFVQTGDTAYIVDAEHPERRGDWKVDFGMPYMQQTVDYAIVARFHDATTGGPVMVVAGISSNGTDAAGEFIASPEALASLASLAPGGRLDQNFEAVLKVEVVGGNSGATSIVASTFWK